MSPNRALSDIFYWPDGYWCYRDDFYKQPRLDYGYRVFFAGTAAWLQASSKPPISAIGNPMPPQPPPGREDPSAPQQ